MNSDNKNTKLTFYVVCALLLGAPYIWRIIKLMPEILKTIPNAAEILAASGYTALIIASMIIAVKMGEGIWLKIISIYSTCGLAVCVLTMMTAALGDGELFNVLFQILCAPYYGIDSPMAVAVLMTILVIVSNVLKNRIVGKKPENDPK